MLKKIILFVTFLIFHNLLAASEQNDFNTIFNWAEEQYVYYFSPKNQITQHSGVWSYRYYPNTGNYLGINNSTQIYILGKSFGSTPIYVDTAANILNTINDNSGFSVISGEDWNETAVRKVLHIFTYGGHSTDEQITQWANMPPQNAIKEILSFEPSNLKLSPSSNDVLGRKTDGTLQSLAELWSSDDPENPIPNEFKNKYIIQNYILDECYSDGELFGYDHYSNMNSTWIHSVLAKGSNPFLHKIGFWETNYHMVVNLPVVDYWNVLVHYDNILKSLMNGDDYQTVMTSGALSIAIGKQYGHAAEYWMDGYATNQGNYQLNGIFYGNEDFAREFHQLFFGVLGDQEHDYHETTTIKNTAKALTDISYQYLDISSQCDYQSVRAYPHTSSFGTEKHHSGSLEMYHQSISGSNAEEKIIALADIAIQQQESLDNLPIMIIRGLADDNLTDEKTKIIQNAWQAMPNKDLLSFLRNYAISNTFHSSERIKYLSSFDRNLILYNRLDLDNSQLHRVVSKEWYWSLPEQINWQAFSTENVTPFFPIHDVFGHQKGIEAINTPGIFRSVYNRSSEPWSYNFTVIRDQDNWHEIVWSKDMTSVIKPDSNGLYTIKHVTETLWNRLIADGKKNLGTLERAHIYSLLADWGNDLGMRFKELGFVDDENYVFSKQELETNSNFSDEIEKLANQSIALDSNNNEEKTLANEKLNLALAFIAATPYMFIQEGK